MAICVGDEFDARIKLRTRVTVRVRELGLGLGSLGYCPAYNPRVVIPYTYTYAGLVGYAENPSIFDRTLICLLL